MIEIEGHTTIFDFMPIDEVSEWESIILDQGGKYIRKRNS